VPPARPQFAKPRPAPPAPDPRAGRSEQLFGHPAVTAITAAAFFMVCAAGLVSFTGNPKAGAPVVRLSLAHVGDVVAPPSYPLPREPSGEAPFGAETVELTQPDEAPQSAVSGSAIITMSDEAVGQAMQAGGQPALPQAPIAGLFTETAAGPLPAIGADGRTPAQAYARPFAGGGKPKVALIIGGLGLNAKATREAIETLPPEVTLSFVPYADGLQGWIDQARAAGHEVLLETPMEPKSFPDSDPGPYTLLADAPPAQITQRLDWLLSRATGYYGVTNYLGSKFLQAPAAVSVFETELRQRGLAFIDDGSAARVGGAIPRASADRIIDDSLDGSAIGAQLAALETQASRSGHALGSGFAYPITLEEAAKWAAGLSQRGYELTPASALAARR